ncbi:MAG: Na/Pi cotransporter family protein [Candidatus Krumholzibacteriia bacterium]
MPSEPLALAAPRAGHPTGGRAGLRRARTGRARGAGPAVVLGVVLLLGLRPGGAGPLAAPAGVAAAAAAAKTATTGAAADTAVTSLRLTRAADMLGRDISGNRQAMKPFAPGSQPRLVQVRDGRGAPVAGVPVLFAVEPEFDADGLSYTNGGLHALAPRGTGGYAPRPVGAMLKDAQPRLTVLSDFQGYAGVYYFPAGRVETVQVTASLPERSVDALRFSLRVIDPKWTLLLWSGLLGGLALFLTGMRMTSTGLEQMAGNRLRVILGRVTDNRLLGLLTGIVVTALVQSSSATTVMVVSFTNAGLMSLGQTLAIILGADVGTTLTVQLLAFSLKDYSLLIVFLGFVLSALPRRRYRSSGQFVIGVGLIFYGMALMNKAMTPLQDLPAFRQVLVGSGEQPLLVLLAAMVFTALIHNSAATIGIVLTLAFQGLIGLQTAIPAILGANIGTCITAVMAAFGTRREAQRTAVAHIFFKVTAALVFLPFMRPFAALVARTSPDLPRQIANAHTMFNVTAALLFLPTLKWAEGFLRRLMPEKAGEGEKVWSPKYIDERILEVPVLALAQVQREIMRMGDTVLNQLRIGFEVFRDRSEEKANLVRLLDDKVDTLDEALRRYLTRLGRQELGQAQAAKAASLLYMVHHLESIGDLLSKNLMGLADKVLRDDLHFSEEGTLEWSAYYRDVIAMLEKALAAFATNDQVMAREVVAMKADMARRARNLHFEHLDRFGKGIPEAEQTSSIHIHLISDLRRIVSNTASIGAAVVNEYRLPDDATTGHDGGHGFGDIPEE